MHQLVIPIEIFICVDTNALVDITLSDSYGDGYGGSTSGGSVDGNVEVFSCDGVELFDLVDTVGTANFGYQYFQSDHLIVGIFVHIAGQRYIRLYEPILNNI